MRAAEILRITLTTIVVSGSAFVVVAAPLVYRCGLTAVLAALAINGAAQLPGMAGAVGKSLLKGVYEGVQAGAREVFGFTVKWLIVVLAAYVAWKYFGDDVTKWLFDLMRQAAADVATGVMDNFKGLFS